MKNYLTIFTLSGLIFSCTPKEEGFVTKTAEEGGYTYKYVTNDPMKTSDQLA